MDRREFTQRMLATGVAAGAATSSAVHFLSPTARAQEQLAGGRKVAVGRRHVAATVHPIATQAAMRVLEAGGNAVDAAVAASLMLSVVDIHNSGLGGGGLALVRTPQGEIFALDGRERAPLSANPGTFSPGGVLNAQLSQTGPLASGTPGLFALLARLDTQFGTGRIGTSLRAAAEVAGQGFAIDAPMARNLTSHRDDLGQFPESARVLLPPSGKPWSEGDHLIQTDLARTLELLAQHGSTWFYHGEFAERVSKLMSEHSGILNAADFANYFVAERRPIECSYRRLRVTGFPPPSSGGIHIAQMLGMLSQFDVRAIFEQSEARGLHVLAEVMKRAMADRAHWLGDSDFAPVPRGLLDEQYLADRANGIDLDRSTAVENHGMPPRSTEDLFAPGKHTTHLTCADEQGFVVALTQTINTSFGSKMMVPGTGVLLNNEMDDFSLAPGVRNAFGLVGSAANAVAPGKRPLSSMSPTIVLDEDNRFRLTVGAAGGPKIITSVLQILVRCIDLGQSIEAALAAPRLHHQWSPDTLAYEDAMPPEFSDSWQDSGHVLVAGKSLSVAQGIEVRSGGDLLAASDPRVPSLAAGA